MSGFTPSVRRCPETRAHYAHEWYLSGLRVDCPGGPDEGVTSDEQQSNLDAFRTSLLMRLAPLANIANLADPSP